MFVLFRPTGGIVLPCVQLWIAGVLAMNRTFVRRTFVVQPVFQVQIKLCVQVPGLETMSWKTTKKRPLMLYWFPYYFFFDFFMGIGWIGLLMDC